MRVITDSEGGSGGGAICYWERKGDRMHRCCLFSDNIKECSSLWVQFNEDGNLRRSNTQEVTTWIEKLFGFLGE